MKQRITVLALTIGMAVSAHATSNNSVQQQIDDLKAGLHQVHMNTLQKYSESWGLEDRANIEKLQSSKVDKSAFTADQQRQDKALASAVQSQSLRNDVQDEHINAVQDAAQSANEKADGLSVRADKTESAIRETNAQIEVTDARSQNNAFRLDSVESVNSQQDMAISNHESRITNNASDIVALYGENSYNSSRIDAANANIEANRQASISTNRIVSQHSQQLASHEQRLNSLEQQASNMNGRIDRVEKRANAGTSAALSSANIPQVTEYQRFAVGAGVGGYEGESALAVGFSSRVSSSVVVKGSATTDSQHGFGYGAGVSWGF